MIREEGAVTDTASLATRILEEEARRQAAADADARADAQVVEDDQLAGVGDEAMSLREVLRTGGIASAVVLTVLVIVNYMDQAAFSVLSPEIQDSLNISDLVLGLIGSIGGLVLFVAAIPLGVLGDRTRRWTIVGICTLVSGFFAIATGAVQNGFQLILARMGNGAAEAHRTPIHNALIVDTYPPQGRARIFALHQGAGPASRLIGPAAAGGLAAMFGGIDGWRMTFVVLGLPALVLGVISLFMREPPRGRYEKLAVLGDEQETAGDEVQITVGAALARLKKIKTFYYTMAALGALGLGTVSVPIYISLILDERFGVSPAGRGVIASVTATGAVVGAVIAGSFGDRFFRKNPGLPMVLAGAGIAILGISLPLEAYAPNVYVYMVVGWFSGVATGGAFIPVSPVIAAVTPYRLRSMGFALIGLYMSLLGGLGGSLLIGILSESFGRQMAIAIMGPATALTGGALLAYGSRFARGDMEAAAAELLEERDEKLRADAGGEVSLLQVRRLDYSYGPVQVLFDVNIDVRENEVLALLGTNGAGKSTLLKAISGLGYPDRGAIRMRGRTLTFADPTTRVRMGIVQVAGGKGVFPSLTVAENLAVGAHTFIWDRDLVEERAAEALSLFPVLEQRGNQLAGTLSGGERQMLAIAKGLMLKPELLLLDELTLGLAPVVVQQILPTIERLKEQGLTIVIVEQSVNVALSVADRAIFMEKGRVRFEGPARELLDRDDLVRAVFLGGEGG